MVGQWKIHGHNLFGDLAGVGDYVGSSSSDRKCREHLPPDYSEPSTSLSRRCWRSMRASSNPSTEIDRRNKPWCRHRDVAVSTPRLAGVLPATHRPDNHKLVELVTVGWDGT